jgi:antitoxin VapB
MKLAKLFKNGRSQAVRLPKEFRFSGNEVLIHSEGNRVILEPLASAEWPKGFFEDIRILDGTFQRPPQGEMPPPVDLSAT